MIKTMTHLVSKKKYGSTLCPGSNQLILSSPQICENYLNNTHTHKHKI